MDDVEMEYGESRRLAKSGDTAGALLACERALSVQPSHLGAMVWIGVLLYRSGDLKSAEAKLRSALAIAPGNAYANFTLGRCLCDQRDLDGAAAYFQAATVADPRFTEAHYNLGWVRWHLGMLSEARECFERVLALQPDANDARAALMHCIVA